jgi:hypothetical protein
MLRLIAVCLVLLGAPLAASGVAAAPGLQLLPFDEAPADPRFQAFRDALLDAVQRRDVAAVVAAAGPTILLSFGEDSGPETLRLWLTGGGPVEAPYLWAQLEDVLAHGGGFDQQGGFSAPYWFAATPPLPDDTDWYAVLYVIGDKVRLRAGPGTDQPVLGTVSYEVVFADDPQQLWATDAAGKEWLQVRTLDGRRGWIREDFLRGPYGYRAGFELLEDGRWAMTYFLAGD